MDSFLIFVSRSFWFSEISTFVCKVLPISSKFLLNRCLNLFVEIDFYTSTVIIVKDVSDLTNEDLILIVSEAFDFKKFKNYLI